MAQQTQTTGAAPKNTVSGIRIMRHTPTLSALAGWPRTFVGVAGALILAIAALSAMSAAASAQPPVEAPQSLAGPLEQGEALPAAPSPQPPATLPDLVGKGLQFAQDTAQAAGFHSLKSHDALGRDRHQILDRDWMVCFQYPKPGKVDPATTIDFSVVKVEEKCPTSDEAAPSPTPAGAMMPDLVGKSLNVAKSALPNASLTLTDGTGQHRVVSIASNWQVCSTNPKAGQPYNGVPVAITVVKFGEACP
jgi:beta-lactam-binding protein with PASTA domain